MSEGTVEETVESSVDAITSAVEEEEFEVDADTDALDRESFGRELGSRIGREVGATVGRGLGGLVVTSARERNDPRSVLGDVRDYLVRVTREVLQHAAVEASLSDVRERVTEAAPTDILEDASESANEAAETVTESGEEAEDEESDGDETDRSREELESLREDTLRELLEVMSYSELQSIAKDVDVKANLDRETMTEEIVSSFVDGDGEE